MIRRVALVAAVGLMTRPASAQPAAWAGYASAGTRFSAHGDGEGIQSSYKMLLFQGALAIPTVPIFVRLSTGAGMSSDDHFSGDGRAWLLRGGLEAQTCDQFGVWCLFAAVEVGFEGEQYFSMLGAGPEGHASGPMYGTQLGVGTNGDRWGVRAGVEFYRYHLTLERDGQARYAADATGLGLSFAIVRRFGPDAVPQGARP